MKTSDEILTGLIINSQSVMPLTSSPLLEISFDKFFTNEEIKILKQQIDLKKSKHNQSVCVSDSYSILHDCDLHGLIQKIDYCINYYAHTVLQTDVKFKMVGSGNRNG